jgi:UDP-3-O-acyl-N-acetylglucosamine deacetylase
MNRQAVLDAIGDLSLAGFAIRANYEGYKPGHSLNAKLLKAVFERDSGAWAFAPSQARDSSSMAPGFDRVELGKVASCERALT